MRTSILLFLLLTEPINDENLVQVNYRASFTHSTGERSTCTPNSATGAFDRLDSTLTSSVVSDYLTQALGVGYRIQNAPVQARCGSRCSTRC